MSFLDLTLVILLLLSAVGGWKRGLIGGLLSLAGFLIGGYVAMQFAPTLLAMFSVLEQFRVPSSLIIILVGAGVGNNLAVLLGSAIQRAMTFTPARGLDRLGGVAFNVLSVSLIIWLVAQALVTNTGLWQRQVNSSRVIGAIDEVAPSFARSAVNQFQGWLDSSGLPRVIAGIGLIPNVSVPPPNPDLGQTTTISSRASSVVRIEGAAEGCSGTLIGTGFVFAPNQVMTNAHVVAGVEKPTVGVPGGRVFSATVVAIDTDSDIAVLHVPDLTEEPIPFGSAALPGQEAVALGYAGGGPLVAVPARVRDTVELLGSDIYGRGSINRNVIVLRAEIEQGDSGGPLLNSDGEVVGLIFAEAIDDTETGFALALDEITDDAQTHRASTEAVNVGLCSSAR